MTAVAPTAGPNFADDLGSIKALMDLDGISSAYGPFRKTGP